MSNKLFASNVSALNTRLFFVVVLKLPDCWLTVCGFLFQRKKKKKKDTDSSVSDSNRLRTVLWFVPCSKAFGALSVLFRRHLLCSPFTTASPKQQRTKVVVLFFFQSFYEDQWASTFSEALWDECRQNGIFLVFCYRLVPALVTYGRGYCKILFGIISVFISKGPALCFLWRSFYSLASSEVWLSLYSPQPDPASCPQRLCVSFLFFWWHSYSETVSWLKTQLSGQHNWQPTPRSRCAKKRIHYKKVSKDSFEKCRFSPFTPN